MATSIGMQWRHGAILTKCKLLNVISNQLTDCNVIIDHYRHIAVHKLDQNYIEKLKFGQNLAQWTVVVIIISSRCQFFIPIMLCESLESVG